MRDAVAPKTPIVSVPSWALPPLTTVIGVLLRDRCLTTDEYNAMADRLADSQTPANGQTRFTDSPTAHAESLGRRYINDTRRHFAPAQPTSLASDGDD